MFSNILVPTDGSPLAFKVVERVERAVEFARDIAATVVFLTVVEPFHIISIESEQLEHFPIRMHHTPLLESNFGIPPV